MLMEQGRHDQLAITTHADAMRALKGCRLEINEEGCASPRLTNGGQLQNPTPQDAHESPPASAGTAALPVARAN